MATKRKARRTRHWRLSELKTFRQVLAEEMARDPAFRREWERTALARAVAIRLIRYRADHGLSQTNLAKKLGVSQAYVSALELGERNPQLDRLARLATILGIPFLIDIQPPRGPRSARRWVTAAVNRAAVVERVRTEGSRVLVAAG